MELVLCRDIVSVLKLAQPLCMFARTTILSEERRKVDTDMTNMVCVVSTDLPEEWGYVLRGAKGKIEAILGVEQLDGFVLDSSIGAEELRIEILSSIAIFPGINRGSWCNRTSSYIWSWISRGRLKKLENMSLSMGLLVLRLPINLRPEKNMCVW